MQGHAVAPDGSPPSTITSEPRGWGQGQGIGGGDGRGDGDGVDDGSGHFIATLRISNS